VAQFLCQQLQLNISQFDGSATLGALSAILERRYYALFERNAKRDAPSIKIVYETKCINNYFTFDMGNS